MREPYAPTLGKMIRGYRLEEELGAGKVTTLYRACTEELWLPPELTIMLVHVSAFLSTRAKEQFAERFIREAGHLIKLRHPALHPLFGYGEKAGQFYLLFPPLPPSCTTLSSYLASHKSWSPSEAYAILASLSSALDYLHQQGLAYQFFTPDTVLLSQTNTPQITGVGITQLLSLQGLDDELYRDEPHRHLKNVAGDYVNSLAYMAPEAIRGEAADARSDVYSLGILLFELLSGQRPFEGANPMDIAQKHLRSPLPSLHEFAPTVPIALELVINRALHRNPDHRFATAGELLVALSHVLNERLRSPAFLSLERVESKQQTSPFSTLSHGDHQASMHNVENVRRGKRTPHTSVDLPALLVENETDSSTTEALDRELIRTEMRLSGERSLTEDIHKMAQQVQLLRERIQGEYNK